MRIILTSIFFTLLSSIKAHCRIKTLQREDDQMSSRFQMCSSTADLCSRRNTKNPERETKKKVRGCSIITLFIVVKLVTCKSKLN